MSNKNKSRLIKRLITGAMCLTLVFSINGFASVVSDNDGSAFITKAEFDSLKNNFQSQIDQYNQSIDSKIDGAIAAYLAGINIVNEQAFTIDTPNYNELWWMRKWQIYGNKKSITSGGTISTENDKWFDLRGEKRMNLRAKYHSWIWTAWSFYGDSFYAQASWDFADSTNKVPFIYANWPATNVDGAYPFPVWYIGLDSYSDGDTIVEQPCLFYQDNDCYICGDLARQVTSNFGNAKVAACQTSDTEQAWWSVNSNPMGLQSAANALNVLTPETDEVMRVKVNMYLGNSTSRTANVTFGCLSKYNTIIPRGQRISLDNGHYFGTLTRVSAGTAAADIGKAYFDDGVNTYYSQNTANYTAVRKSLAHAMIGGTNDYTLNIDRSGGAYNNTIYIHNELSPIVKAKFTVTKLGVAGGAGLAANTLNPYVNNPSNGTGLMNIPLLEQIGLRNIYGSKRHQTTKERLKLGQGIPISYGIPSKGTVKLTWDANVARVLSPTGTTTQDKIKLSLRKQDYFHGSLTDNATYYKAKINGGTTDVLLKEAEIDISGGKVNLVIEGVESRDAMWLQMMPSTEEGGYYVTMDNFVGKVSSDQ